MNICYVMSKNVSTHNQKFLDKFKERNIEYCTIRVGLKTAGFDVLRLKRLIRKEKSDILHAGWVLSSGFVSALARYHPFVLSPWGGDIFSRPYENPVYKRIVRYTINSADIIACNAESIKDKVIELTNYPEEKIAVIPWGIDLKEYTPHVTGDEIREKLGWENRKILIMNRRFESAYDHMTFINSLPDIVTSNPGVSVILIGVGPTFPQIKEIVHKKGLDEYVHFFGRIPMGHMPKYLAASDVYISTSLYDGTSASLLEAMACGLPCVVTDVLSNMEWIKNGENGYITPRKNSEILASKIISLLQDEDNMKQFGKRNGAIAKKRADWDKNFLELEKIYKRLIK